MKISNFYLLWEPRTSAEHCPWSISAFQCFKMPTEAPRKFVLSSQTTSSSFS